MEDKFLKFLKDIIEVVVMIGICKREKRGNKEVIKWHTKLDEILHRYVGEEGLTEEEK